MEPADVRDLAPGHESKRKRHNRVVEPSGVLGLDVKILVLTNSAESLIKVRMQLLSALKATGHKVFASAPGCPAKVMKTLAEAGIEYRPAHVERLGLNPARELKALWSLFQLSRKIEPDAILAYTSKPIVYGAL